MITEKLTAVEDERQTDPGPFKTKLNIATFEQDLKENGIIDE